MRGATLPAMLALGVLMQGCASSDVPAEQTVRVQTPGCARSACELSNDRGVWQLAHTPGGVSVQVSREPLRVSCRADDATAVAGADVEVSRPPTSGTGSAAGAVVGGAAVGATLGATALAFIPPLGVVAVLTGAGVGAVAGNTAESRSHPPRYPALISLPMVCTAEGSAHAVGSRPPLGVTIRGLTLAEARALGLGDRTAVLVIHVAAGSRAATAGLQAGDTILALEGQAVADAADLEERVLAWPSSRALALDVWRDRQVVALVLAGAPQTPP